jgi:hypothetical protein
VLLKDLVDAHVVEVGVLLERQVLLADRLGLGHQRGGRRLVVARRRGGRAPDGRLALLLRGGRGGPRVERAQLGAQLVDQALRELADLLDLALEALEEALLGRVGALGRAHDRQARRARRERDGAARLLRLRDGLLDEVLEAAVVDVVGGPLRAHLALEVLAELHGCSLALVAEKRKRLMGGRGGGGRGGRCLGVENITGARGKRVGSGPGWGASYAPVVGGALRRGERTASAGVGVGARDRARSKKNEPKGLLEQSEASRGRTTIGV